MSRRFSHFRLPDPLMSSPAPAWAMGFGSVTDGQALFLRHLQFHPKGCSLRGLAHSFMRWRPAAESLTDGLDSGLSCRSLPSVRHEAPALAAVRST